MLIHKWLIFINCSFVSAKSCRQDHDCENYEGCLNGYCENPCDKTICPQDSEDFVCVVNNHTPCCTKSLSSGHKWNNYKLLDTVDSW